VGVLPAQSAQRSLSLRRLASAGAAAAVVVAVVPPVSTIARRYDFVEAIQFALLAVAAPALLVLGAPWQGWGRLDALEEGRRRRPEAVRSIGFVVLFGITVVAWRVPVSVDGLVRYPWLLAVEAVTLVAAGVGLWLELVDSPPLTPRAGHPWRALYAALAMWTIWITAYAVGLSRGQVYASFHHVAGGLSVAADQEVTTGALWAVALCAFVPVIFASLVSWLNHAEQPEEELRRIVRENARRSAWRDPP
jgi:cytochrome c oxidase assembly factor CtaG